MKGVKSHGKEKSSCKENQQESKESLILDQFGKPVVVEAKAKQTEKGKNMTNELVKQEAQLPAEMTQGSWGSEGIDKKDIMLPKILMMQGLSKKVAEGGAALGDLINSLTGEKLGDRTHAVEIIPISTYKTWVVSKKEAGKNKFEFNSVIPATKENYREFNDRDVMNADGSCTRYDETLNFFVLVASELAEGAALPYVLSCRRTSYKAGKMIIGHFTKMSMLKQPPAAKTLLISCKQERNDDGAFDTMVVASGRVTTPAELATAFEWYKTLAQGTHKIDDSDLKATESNADAEGTAQY